MNKDQIEKLVNKYLLGTISSEEERQLNAWYESRFKPSDAADVRDKQSLDDFSGEIWEKLSKKLDDQSASEQFFFRRKLRPTWKMIAAAVILLVAAGAVLHRFLQQNKAPGDTMLVARSTSRIKSDIHPGKPGATLHLSNGKIINLDSLKNGAVISQGNVKLVKQDGQLHYEGQTTANLYNQVSTQLGQRWQLTLPDGTEVWLNAGSSIRYPLRFDGKERVVSITGEAFFDVVHNSASPFKVKVAGAVIEDLGTRFNVNAYQNETGVKTTLVQGSVKVFAGSGSRLLVPGQQAVSGVGDAITVRTVNVLAAIGWKNDEIVFDNRDFQTIMREIQRWYAIEVVYQSMPPSIHLEGGMSSDLNLSQFLKILDFENVKYNLNGTRLTIE